MPANAHKDSPSLELNSLALFTFRRWKLGVQLTTAACMLGALSYLFVVPYNLKTTLLINDAQTSQLQAFTNNFFALSKVQSSARKAQTPAQNAIDFLERQDTYTNLLRTLAAHATAPGASADTQKGFQLLESYLKFDSKRTDFNIRQSANELRSLIRLSSNSPSEVSLSINTKNRELTFFLNSEYSRFAMDSLRQAEETEMEQVRLAIEKQRDRFKSQFEISTKELIAFQTRPENVLSLASGASVGNYISDLVVRQNDIELKIAENERTIEYLGGTKAATLAANRNLGGRSQAQQLVEETALLKKQAFAIQDSIRKFTSATNGAAEALRMHEELKKTADREFKNFQEANDLLAKLEVYAVSIARKFEILHVSEAEEVRKAASLPLVLAIAILLAQFGFASMVYFRWTNQALAPRARRPRREVGVLNSSSMNFPQEVVSSMEYRQ